MFYSTFPNTWEKASPLSFHVFLSQVTFSCFTKICTFYVCEYVTNIHVCCTLFTMTHGSPWHVERHKDSKSKTAVVKYKYFERVARCNRQRNSVKMWHVWKTQVTLCYNTALYKICVSTCCVFYIHVTLK